MKGGHFQNSLPITSPGEWNIKSGFSFWRSSIFPSPHSAAPESIPAALEAWMSHAWSPIYMQSSGLTSKISAALMRGWGSGLCFSVSSWPTTAPKYPSHPRFSRISLTSLASLEDAIPKGISFLCRKLMISAMPWYGSITGFVSSHASTISLYTWKWV